MDWVSKPVAAARNAFARIGRCVLAALVFAGQAGAAEPPARPEPGGGKQQIYVGATIDSYPYSFVDESGRLTGFAVELLDAVAGVMDFTIRREIGPGLEINRRFAAGEFDVNQLYSITPERAAFAHFSVPYLILNGAIFVRSDDNRFASLEDLRRKSAIVASAGGPAYDFARQHGLSAEQLRTLSTEETIRQLADGRADAALISRLSGLAQIHRLKIDNVVPVGDALARYPSRFCFAVHRDSDALLTQINEGLAILHHTGEFDVIYQRWFGRYEPRAFTRAEVIAYVAGALAVALLITLWAFVRQRQLRRRLALQAAELADSRELLAEAQRFAQLGHWQRMFGPPPTAAWSDETYRVFERDKSLGPPASIDELLEWAGGPDTARWREAMERAMSEHVSYDLDLSIEPKRGLKKTVHVRGRVVHEQSGRVIGLFGTVQDITERRAAELALRRSERLMRAFYENLPHAVGVVERHGDEWQVVSLNRGAVRFFGLESQPPLPCLFACLKLEPEVEREWQALFARCAQADGPFKVESQSRDGRRSFITTLVPLGPDVQPVQCYFLVEDVTEQRQKDTEIAQGRRLRALGGLVGGIAHEFNNLLTPILIQADQLRSHAGRNRELLEGLSLIGETARRSADLTRRLLAFGRNRQRSPEVFDLQIVIDNAVALLRQTSDRRIQIECTFARDLPKLYLCSNDVHQILFNLLLNARDTLVEKLGGSPPPGWHAEIQVEAMPLPADVVEPIVPRRCRAVSWIELAVRDNGMGMPPGVIERVFEPFYTTKEVGRGTGLGLATVWHLVSELGGRVDVESTPGHGSCFRLALPVEPPPLTTARPAPAPVTATVSGESLSVLVADDEPMITKLLSSVLKTTGHGCTVVPHGAEAWRRLSNAPGEFDALIMDLNMPELSGLELARRARKLPFDRPILVMSGNVTDDDRAELARIGIAGILYKPFTADEFVAAFRAHVMKG